MFVQTLTAQNVCVYFVVEMWSKSISFGYCWKFKLSVKIIWPPFKLLTRDKPKPYQVFHQFHRYEIDSHPHHSVWNEMDFMPRYRCVTTYTTGTYMSWIFSISALQRINAATIRAMSISPHRSLRKILWRNAIRLMIKKTVPSFDFMCAILFDWFFFLFLSFTIFTPFNLCVIDISLTIYMKSFFFFSLSFLVSHAQATPFNGIIETFPSFGQMSNVQTVSFMSLTIHFWLIATFV